MGDGSAISVGLSLAKSVLVFYPGRFAENAFFLELPAGFLQLFLVRDALLGAFYF